MFSTWLVESEDFLLIFVTLCTSLTESQTIAEIKSNAKILTKKEINLAGIFFLLCPQIVKI